MVHKDTLKCGYASGRVQYLLTSIAYADAGKGLHSSPFCEHDFTHQFFQKDLAHAVCFEEVSVEWLRKLRGLFL